MSDAIEVSRTQAFDPEAGVWLLVRIYSDGSQTVASRADHFAMWGPECDLRSIA